ncbi:acyl-CoA N-acyltransferase [Annulohypoxylon bovei var. microspora]|nr:acyl-CoA N-acyltransferase [Annulohypoxylon bovei var. microspora]
MEEQWTVDANEALTISLVRPGLSGIENIESFKPKFTYSIFGEDEQIFGHKGLKINLRFDARDLRPNLSVSSLRKFNSIGDVEALDVKETLREYLPGVAIQSKKDFEQAVNSISETWTPPGSLVKTINKNGEVYEIWHGTLAMPIIQQMVKRIQILVLFYIEGGSYITDLDGVEESEAVRARWSVFFVYKVTPTSQDKQYTFQGFATTHKFWMFQPPTAPGSGAKKVNDLWELSKGGPDDEMVHRMRISQFVILPPFQGKGIGSMLYSTMFNIAMNASATIEVTVEDPNEDFDLLRDLCDMKYLRKNVPEFARVKVNTDIAIPEKGGLLHNNTRISGYDANTSDDGIVDMEKLESLRIKHKIAPRQFMRLVEMQLMSKLPDSVRPQSDPEAKKSSATKAEKHVYVLWRILLKQRLYRRNVAILGEFEITERIIKLNDVLDNVEWEYARILDRLEPKPVTGGKRKLNSEADVESPSSKKARVEDA